MPVSVKTLVLPFGQLLDLIYEPMATIGIRIFFQLMENLWRLEFMAEKYIILKGPVCLEILLNGFIWRIGISQTTHQ